MKSRGVSKQFTRMAGHGSQRRSSTDCGSADRVLFPRERLASSEVRQLHLQIPSQEASGQHEQVASYPSLRLVRKNQPYADVSRFGSANDVHCLELPVGAVMGVEKLRICIGNPGGRALVCKPSDTDNLSTSACGRRTRSNAWSVRNRHTQDNIQIVWLFVGICSVQTCASHRCCWWHSVCLGWG